MGILHPLLISTFDDSTGRGPAARKWKSRINKVASAPGEKSTGEPLALLPCSTNNFSTCVGVPAHIVAHRFSVLGLTGIFGGCFALDARYNASIKKAIIAKSIVSYRGPCAPLSERPRRAVAWQCRAFCRPRDMSRKVMTPASLAETLGASSPALPFWSVNSYNRRASIKSVFCGFGGCVPTKGAQSVRLGLIRNVLAPPLAKSPAKLRTSAHISLISYCICSRRLTHATCMKGSKPGSRGA